jgi:DNA-binding CsgD family transcriptional regulator
LHAVSPGPHTDGPDGWTSPPARLTPRQLEVLALLCEGLPNKIIARRLNIATGTVKIHVGCILRELGVATRLQAVVATGGGRVLAGLAAGATARGADRAVRRDRTERAPSAGSSAETGATS